MRDRIKAIFTGSTTERLFALPTDSVLAFEPGVCAPEDEHWEVLSPLAVHALNELAGSGLAIEDSGNFHILWDHLYAALNDVDRAAALRHLGIPPVGELRPRLRSVNSLDDADFEIAIEGWLDHRGRTSASKLGAIARTERGLELLPQVTYELTKGVSEFCRQPARTAESNRFHWGRIRTLAVRANAGLDQFLAETVVLTPEKLHIKLIDADVAGSSVVEVQPWFTDAPETWLDCFDRTSKVKDRYQIVTQQGLVEIQISPPVKAVLAAIKAMPGQRTSGAAAEKFLHNPFATLGPDAVRVLDEAQFDNARREAGIDFERFVTRIQMTDGVIHEVGVVAERMAENAGSSVYERFQSPSDLRAFIARVESKLRTGSQLCEWRHHRLELTGDSANELELLNTAYIEWTKPKVEIRAVDVLDLTRYSQRISGIGVQPRIVSPYIPVQSGEDPWWMCCKNSE